MLESDLRLLKILSLSVDVDCLSLPVAFALAVVFGVANAADFVLSLPPRTHLRPSFLNNNKYPPFSRRVLREREERERRERGKSGPRGTSFYIHTERER